MEKKIPTIRDLYPDLSPDEQQQAEAFFEQYLELVLRIHYRQELDRSLTDEVEISTMK